MAPCTLVHRPMHPRPGTAPPTCHLSPLCLHGQFHGRCDFWGQEVANSWGKEVPCFSLEVLPQTPKEPVLNLHAQHHNLEKVLVWTEEAES